MLLSLKIGKIVKGAKLQIGFSTVTSLIFLQVICSCSPSHSVDSKANQSFREKYGKEIKRLNANRTVPKQQAQSLKNFAPTLPEETRYEVGGYNTDVEQSYANVDADEYLDSKARQFFPDASNLAAKKNQQFPDDVFVMTYNTNLNSQFIKYGAEFDYINVPPYDVYGVRTKMSDKEYLLVGNNSLQKNIDQINNSRSASDVNISEILIKEQRQLKRKRRVLKTFGDNALEFSDSVKEKNIEEKNMKKPDDLKQAKVEETNKNQPNEVFAKVQYAVSNSAASINNAVKN